MIKERCVQAECAIKEELAKGGRYQIHPPDYFGNFHHCIVHHHGELIAGQIIFSPDEKITKISSGNPRLRPERLIAKRYAFVLANTKPPVHTAPPGGGTFSSRWTTGPGINGLIVAFVRSGERALHILARASAWKNQPGVT